MARHEITLKPVVYEIPGMHAVAVKRDIEYARRDNGALTMDIYYPGVPTRSAHPPAVIIVGGFPDVGVALKLGCPAKDMEMVISWARLIAASEMAAVTYTKSDPAADARAVVAFLQAHAASLDIDGSRLGVWAASGNVPVALSLLMGSGPVAVKWAALCYGFMLDSGGATVVAEAAKTWGFANPCAGSDVSDVRPDVALFIARAGFDHLPGLNAMLDRFVAQALERNLPITVANHASGPHAFDVMDDSDRSREIIRAILAFLQFHGQH
jgi:hypothetical protein